MVTFATRCLNCTVCLDLPTGAVQVTVRDGKARWSYRCPMCHATISRAASANQLASFALVGLVPTALPEPPLIEGKPPVGAPISEADVERFARAIGALADG